VGTGVREVARELIDEGLDELDERLRRLGSEVEDTVRKPLQAPKDEVERLEVPKQTAEPLLHLRAELGCRDERHEQRHVRSHPLRAGPGMSPVQGADDGLGHGCQNDERG
jgi:hypothetical protein